MILYLPSISLLLSLVFAQSTFKPVRPPSIPLAVRSPYISTWQAAGSDGGNGGYLAGQWPSFWSGQFTGWCGFIRVDGVTYTWMGDPKPLPKVVSQTGFEYTSTKSTFTMSVNGMVSMEIAFLSPVDPQDKLRQSMPVSYMSVKVSSSDGNSHEVSIYTDISAEWTSGDRDQIAEWGQGVATGSSDVGSGDIAYHKVWRQQQQEFSETSDQAAWGSWYYATANNDQLSSQSGSDGDVRGQFVQTGRLANTENVTFRAINNDYPVFGFARDLGNINVEPVETVFTVNLLQQNAIQFRTGNGYEKIPSFWTTAFHDELSAVTTMYYDYKNAVKVASALDNSVGSASRAAGGDDYASITSLAVRQAWGALQIAGTEQDNYMFLKEISSDGNIQTVDVIFPFHPILLYMNPKWLKMMLDPLFINMAAPGLWPQDYAIHDLGTNYPNADGHADGNAALQPLEECGNMLIMTLAYAQKTGDTAYLSTHWDILNKWAQWLMTSNNTVVPFNQISTDDFAGKLANQTNLALKGIIGLKAAATIANLTGHAEQSRRYDDQAHDWVNLWQNLAINRNANPPHTTLNYGAEDSHSLLYNLYADALLGTNLIPRAIYKMQSDFYPTKEQNYGVPLDTRALRTKSDWEMFCAAISEDGTRGMFIRNLAKFINETPTSVPITDLFDVDSGNFAPKTGFKARPVVGGWFALLALGKVGIP